jgi:hypothetical protein
MKFDARNVYTFSTASLVPINSKVILANDLQELKELVLKNKKSTHRIKEILSTGEYRFVDENDVAYFVCYYLFYT